MASPLAPLTSSFPIPPVSIAVTAQAISGKPRLYTNASRGGAYPIFIAVSGAWKAIL
jgi:hypothetical protein